MKERIIKIGIILCFLLSTVFLFNNNSYSDVEIKELGNVFDKVTIGGDIHLFSRYTKNVYFGAPFGVKNDKSNGYAEFLTQLRGTFFKNLNWTELEAQIGGAFLGTVGEDFYGLYKDKYEVESDTAYLKFNKIFGMPIDITIGQQYIEIEKWFLIGTGNFQDAAAWLLFLRSFPFGVKVDINKSFFNITTFWAKSKHYYQQWDQWDPSLSVGKNDVSVAGVNFHINIAEPNAPSLITPNEWLQSFYIYLGFYRKFDDSDLVLPNFVDNLNYKSENNTNAFDIGLDLSIANLNLAGEFVYENGDAGELNGKDLDRDAYGYFAWARYTFAQVSFKPYIKLWYVYYSGDDDLTDSDAEDFDPMFTSFLAWNEWTIGELVGEAHLENSNKKSIIGEIGFSPKEDINISFVYIKHELDEPYIGIPGQRIKLSSDDWADEYNLYIDWNISKNLFLHLGGGYVVPDDAAEEVYGDDRNAYFGQVWLWFHF